MYEFRPATMTLPFSPAYSQVLWQQHDLLVQFSIGGAGKQQAAKLTRWHISQWKRADLLG
jgi:hypothetical protein